jgi:hypothetical protein
MLIFMHGGVDGFADCPVAVLVVYELLVQRRVLLALGVIAPRPIYDGKVDRRTRRQR